MGVDLGTLGILAVMRTGNQVQLLEEKTRHLTHFVLSVLGYSLGWGGGGRNKVLLYIPG